MICESLPIEKNRVMFVDLHRHESLAFTLLTHNPFPNKPWFLHVCHTNLMKTV